MYDSASCPFASTFEKADSMIRLFSSSKRSARDMVPSRVCEFIAAPFMLTELLLIEGVEPLE